MAYDAELLRRVRTLLEDRQDVVETRMFGGIAFMVGGRMACGLLRDRLIVRIGKEAAASAICRPHVKPMDFTGKTLSTFATVESNGLRTKAQLRRWVLQAVAYAESLPRKTRQGHVPARSRPADD